MNLVVGNQVEKDACIGFVVLAQDVLLVGLPAFLRLLLDRVYPSGDLLDFVADAVCARLERGEGQQVLLLYLLAPLIDLLGEAVEVLAFARTLGNVLGAVG